MARNGKPFTHVGVAHDLNRDRVRSSVLPRLCSCPPTAKDTDKGICTDSSASNLDDKLIPDPLDNSSLPFGHSTYQLAFWTPGIRPLLAMLRKQMRQMPNFR